MINDKWFNSYRVLKKTKYRDKELFTLKEELKKLKLNKTALTNALKTRHLQLIS